jgi:hypothetical protein
MNRLFHLWPVFSEMPYFLQIALMGSFPSRTSSMNAFLCSNTLVSFHGMQNLPSGVSAYRMSAYPCPETEGLPMS